MNTTQFLSNREIYEQAVLKLVQSAKKRLGIVTADIKAMYVETPGLSKQMVPFLQILAELLKRGVALIPITDYAMRHAEGEQQHNCAASYAQDILDGKSALYRILAPERCTLELVQRNRKWIPNNCSPPAIGQHSLKQKKPLKNG